MVPIRQGPNWVLSLLTASQPQWARATVLEEVLETVVQATAVQATAAGARDGGINWFWYSYLRIPISLIDLPDITE